MKAFAIATILIIVMLAWPYHGFYNQCMEEVDRIIATNPTKHLTDDQREKLTDACRQGAYDQTVESWVGAWRKALSAK